jgi:ABC-type sugar transport system substrate-binding protein
MRLDAVHQRTEVATRTTGNGSIILRSAVDFSHEVTGRLHSELLWGDRKFCPHPLTLIMIRSLTRPVLCFAMLSLLPCCNKAGTASKAHADGKLTIALLPKSKSNQYFLTCEKGARTAAAEAGAELLFDGPISTDPAKQNEIVENWISLGVDAIAAACENKDSISTALRKAQEAGIKVVTYDADATTDARLFFVNQATAEGIGFQLMDTAAELCGDEGEFAIITATLTAANQNEWKKHIEARLASKHAKMKLVDIRACDDLKDKAQAESTNLLSAFPNLKCIMAICSPGVPGAAEAVAQAGKKGSVKVLGLGLPSETKAYVKDDVIQAVILWKVEDLGYLAVKTAADLLNGKLVPGATSMDAGKLGKLEIKGDNILLGKPFVFTKENIDQFDF